MEILGEIEQSEKEDGQRFQKQYLVTDSGSKHTLWAENVFNEHNATLQFSTGEENNTIASLHEEVENNYDSGSEKLESST